MLRNFFFFSSRRRHTRFDCDWSSDVCSSDLSCIGVSRSSLPAASDRGLPCRAGTLYCCRSEEHTSELQSQSNLVCRLLLEKKKNRATAVTCSRIYPAEHQDQRTHHAAPCQPR